MLVILLMEEAAQLEQALASQHECQVSYFLNLILSDYLGKFLLT